MRIDNALREQPLSLQKPSPHLPSSSLQASYRKCAACYPLLGVWQVAHSREVVAFLSPEKQKLKVFVLHNTPSCQEVEEKIAPENIYGGINRSFSLLKLLPLLQEKAASFAVALTGSQNNRSITFIPHLAGAADAPPVQEAPTQNRAWENIRRSLLNVRNAPRNPRSSEEFSSAIEDAKHLRSLVRLSQENRQEHLWERFVMACAALVLVCLKEEKYKEAFSCCKKLSFLFREKGLYPVVENKFGGFCNDIHHKLNKRGKFIDAEGFWGLVLEILDNNGSIEKLLSSFSQGGDVLLKRAQRSGAYAEYEKALFSYASAYHLTQTHREFLHRSEEIFLKILRVEGSYLENKTGGFHALVAHYKEQSAPCALKKLTSEEKRSLLKKLEHLGSFLGVRGSFVAAYDLYMLAYNIGKDCELEADELQRYLDNKDLMFKLQSGGDERLADELILHAQRFKNRLSAFREDCLPLIVTGSLPLHAQIAMTERYKAIVTDLFTETMEIFDPKKELTYALVAFGSLARKEICPFSDFEAALLFDNSAQKSQLEQIAEYFSLSVIALGETKWSILPSEKSFLPSGFSLDGSVNPRYFLDSPQNLAQRQTSLEEDDPVQLNTLRSSILLAGKQEVFTDFKKQLEAFLGGEVPNLLEDEGFVGRILYSHCHARIGVRDYLGEEGNHRGINMAALETAESIDIKKEFLRFPILLLEALCLYYGLDTSCHTIEKLQALCKEGYLPKVLEKPFQEILELGFALRWRMHLDKKNEQDIFSPEESEKEKIRTAYHTLFKPFKILMTNWLAKKVEPKEDPKRAFRKLISCLSDNEALKDLSYFAVAYFSYAEQKIHEKNYVEALSLLEMAVALKNDPVYSKLCGDLYFSLGEFLKAQEMWHKTEEFFAEKLRACEVGTLSTTLPATEEDRKAWEKQKDLLTTLQLLAQEQHAVHCTLQDAFTKLSIETAFPVLSAEASAGTSQEPNRVVSREEFQRVFLESALRTLEKEMLTSSKEPSFASFIALWQPSIAACLRALWSHPEPRQVLESIYSPLPKLYRKEIKNILLNSYFDQLALLQDFYCDEGYLFAAAIKRQAWVANLQRITQQANNSNASLPSIEGTALPKGYLVEESKNQLYSGREFRRTISRGKHEVARVQIGSSWGFLKKNPDSAGDEYAVFLLNHLITGQGSPSVEVLGMAKEQPYFSLHYLLASQEVMGEPLDLFLKNHPEALSKLDKKQFSEMILMALLTDPEDGHPKNYIASYTRGASGEIENVRILGIDNDHAFVKPFVQKGIVFSEDHLFIKTILFCFDQMNDPMHSEVIKQFLLLDPFAVLEEWLEALKLYNEKIGQLFEAPRLYQFWRQKSLVPFFMHPDQVIYIYNKMVYLQSFLKKKQSVFQEVTHLDLLKLVNSRVGRTYEQVLTKSLPPKDRFDLVTKGSYGKEGKTITSTADIKKYTLNLETQNDFTVNASTPEKGLELLRHLTKNKMALQKLHEKIEASWDTIDLRKIIATEDLEKLLKKRDWSKEPLSSVEEIIGKPFRKLALHKFTALTDAALENLLRSCNHPLTDQNELRSLNLKGCTGLTIDSVEVIKKYCVKLEKLNLEGWKISEAVFNEKAFLTNKPSTYLRSLNFRDCQNLITLTIKSATLQALNLEGCSQMRTLILDCPELCAFQVKGCGPLSSYQPSPQTPITIEDYSFLVRFYEQMPFQLELKVERPKVFKAFLKATTANLNLEDLIISFDEREIELSQQLCFQGHPIMKRIAFRRVTNANFSAFSYFLANSPKLEELALEESRWEGAGIRELIRSSKTPFSLKILNSKVTLEGMQIVAEVLRRNALSQLHLENVKIEATADSFIDYKLGDEEVSIISEALAQNRSLVKLSLAQNAITDRGIGVLAARLADNTTLTSLDISNNIWGEQGALSLVRILETNQTLICWNFLGCSILSESIIRNFTTCLHIERLTLPAHFLDYRDFRKQSILHWVVVTGNTKLARDLFSQGMDLHAQDDQGNTPLQLAIQQNEDMGRELKEAYVDRIAFGEKDWKKYFGDVGEQPPLPNNIWEILQSPCPIWPGKKLAETHLLTLIPEKVDENPLTLDSLENLVKNPKGGGNKTEYRYYDDDIKKEHGSKPFYSSYWVLMTKDVLPNTRSKPYDQQLAELNMLAARAPKIKGLGEYQTPTALEAATSILMEYVRSGIRFYPAPENERWTYTRCEETVTVNKTQYRVVVGGLAASGLSVSYGYWAFEHDGLGGARKCFGS